MTRASRLACNALVSITIGCAGGDEASSGELGTFSSDPSEGSGAGVSSPGGSGGSASVGERTSQGGMGGTGIAATGIAGTGIAGTATAAGSAGKSGAGGGGGSSPGGPAPSSTWVNATGNLAGMASECSNLGHVAAKLDSMRVIAGVALHGLWSSDDGGKSWQALGTGAGSAKIANRPSAITFDPEHSEVFWETGIYAGGGLYKTTDGGSTFKQLGPMSFSQDAAIDFRDPERKTLLTGTHGRGIYRSTDGGQTFADISAGVPGNTLWPLLIDSQTHLIGTFDNDVSKAAVYRTTDGGVTWTRVSTLPPAHNGGILRTSDDLLYFPLFGGQGIAKSTDLGRTWTKVTSTAFYDSTIVELPDGKVVTVGADHLMRSSDKGVTWQPIGDLLPFKLAGTGNFGGVTYSVASKTFFLWRADCGSVVLPDAIMSAGFDYTQ
jgi:photosystem II stability/assembly factor-like uncharacterized protein